MRLISDLFYILLFVTMVGSLLTLLSCFLSKALRLPLPLWFGICCMAAYIVPITARETWLISPKEHGWVEGYSILCKVWAGGILFLSLLRWLRSFLGFRAFQGCHPCRDARVLDCGNKCARLAGLRQAPPVFWGKLKKPACVLGVMHPAIILNKSVTKQLTEHELTAVLCHEMIHIKRRHLALGSVFDYVCILNWLNPLVWLMEREFSALCETDCDRHTTAVLADHITSGEYARALLRLLTLSSGGNGNPARSMGVLDYLSAKRRIRQIMARHQRRLLLAGSVAGILGLILTLLFSLRMSKGYFYPYLSGPSEYAAASAPMTFEGDSLAAHALF